jgi:hypothetical protein
MPLDDRYLRCLAFVITDRERRDGSVGPDAIGTSFLVGMPFDDGTDRSFTYVVTAGHVVARAVPYSIRVNSSHGTVDVPIDMWFRHPVQDVAVAPMGINPHWNVVLVGPDIFASSDVQPLPTLGDRVYFIGLLDFLADENVAMVRSGTVGRLDQEQVRVKWDNTESRITAHLIDCRSYKGFSGSPCFIQAQVSEFRDMSKEIAGGAIGNVLFDRTLLLGLVSGHFDHTEQAVVRGDDSLDVHTRINSGVGLVTPARYIKETLEMEELVEQRRTLLSTE